MSRHEFPDRRSAQACPCHSPGWLALTGARASGEGHPGIGCRRRPWALIYSPGHVPPVAASPLAGRAAPGRRRVPLPSTRAADGGAQQNPPRALIFFLSLFFPLSEEEKFVTGTRRYGLV